MMPLALSGTYGDIRANRYYMPVEMRVNGTKTVTLNSGSATVESSTTKSFTMYQTGVGSTTPIQAVSVIVDAEL